MGASSVHALQYCSACGLLGHKSIFPSQLHASLLAQHGDFMYSLTLCEADEWAPAE